jgi:hypothetical protein
MSRPTLTLTDAQARSLVQQLAPIIARHAHDTRHHRPFVHDFVRAVYHATGKTYSAAFYRKLLMAYAPGRTPSTPTIDTEKNLLVYALTRQAIAHDDGVPDTSGGVTGMPDTTTAAAARTPETGIALQQILGLQHHTIALLNSQARAPSSDTNPGLQAYNAYLGERLTTLETELANTRAASARMAARAQEEAAVAADRARQIASLQTTMTAQAAALSAMATELAGAQRFMATQVDGVRGETRAVRERCVQLELQLAAEKQQTDMYRQLALRKNGDGR